MKNRKSAYHEWLTPVLLLLVLAVIPAFSGCATTAGGIAVAGGEQAVGDVYANAKLAKVDKTSAGTLAQKAAVADLNRVGVDLKAFAAGTLSSFELGAVEEQLYVDKVALTSNTDALTQVNSVLNLFAKAVTSVNGLVLPAQAQVQGAIANIVSGFNTSISTYEGIWSVSNPGVWTAPVPVPAPTSSIMLLRSGSEVAMREPLTLPHSEPVYRF